MITERYLVNFYSIGDKEFDQATASSLWLAAALEEYENSGLFINAVVETTDLICNPSEGCGAESKGIRFISTRNPALDENRDEYYNAIRRVILNVKDKLNNPPVGISILSTNYFYFDSI